MIPKTRQEALHGHRNKPHYYLPSETDKYFAWCLPEGADQKTANRFSLELSSFESRIDWSTWGRK